MNCANIVKYTLMCGYGFYILPLSFIEGFINVAFQKNYQCTKRFLYISTSIGLIVGFVRGYTECDLSCFVQFATEFLSNN
jgi:hypothetical protein